MKGIILAGGKATRMYPITKGVCKQLLPVYDKPLVYYPLSILMLSKIKEILIISTPESLPRFADLFGNGKQLGLKISYEKQMRPRGLADAFIVGRDFINKDNVSLILGDNIFYGQGLTATLQRAARKPVGATVFGYYVNDPQKYGVVNFDKKCRVTSIEEKPIKPRSNWAVTGLYYYDNDVVDIARKVKPSKRGEIEITDINNVYLKQKRLRVEFLNRGHAWLDTGSPEALIDASNFIKAIEDRQGLKIGCIEEVAYRMGYITKNNLLCLAKGIPTAYGKYLERITHDE